MRNHGPKNPAQAADLVGRRCAHVLDYIGKPLQRPDGTPVTLTRNGLDFVVIIGDQVVSQTSDNAQTCYVLNQAEVGLSV